jgi:hypothetical protein
MPASIVPATAATVTVLYTALPIPDSVKKHATVVEDVHAAVAHEEMPIGAEVV